MAKTRLWTICKYATPVKYPRHFEIGKDLVRRGLDVTLITSVSNSVAPDDVPKFKGWSKKECHDGLEVIWLNGPSITSAGYKRIASWFWFEFKVLVTMLLHKSKPNCIIASSLSLLSVWSGLILSRIYKCRFIFEVRDIWPLSLVELGGYSESNILIRFLGLTEKIGYRYADVIVGTLPNLQAHVKEVVPKAVSKVKCIPQGVDRSVFEENAVKLSEDYVKEHIPKDKFIVAYTGTLNPNNPIDTLLEVAGDMAAQYEDIHFLILGMGRNKDKYIEKTRNLKNVSFPPPISKREMAHFLSFVYVGYDAFSSRLAKFGLSRNKWIDYMYTKCIIICSYNGFESMINESNSGFFVKYGDRQELKEAIIKVYNMSEKYREDTGDRAKEFIVNKRTFDKLGGKYFNFIYN